MNLRFSHDILVLTRDGVAVIFWIASASLAKKWNRLLAQKMKPPPLRLPPLLSDLQTLKNVKLENIGLLCQGNKLRTIYVSKIFCYKRKKSTVLIRNTFLLLSFKKIRRFSYPTSIWAKAPLKIVFISTELVAL